jgi:hypothetical protein
MENPSSISVSIIPTKSGHVIPHFEAGADLHRRPPAPFSRESIGSLTPYMVVASTFCKKLLVGLFPSFSLANWQMETSET